ncbi:hypothetical protein GCM10009122_22890 [Fulvivirga kasyanovii]|uniref:Tetratricopeptide repeat protein n=1 Tax=Fulvivirga kasyanovii TaxID=396812 RepID=A0ABW9RTH7_9BACT|nr:tetratricopeptide repeat protein [Fulvivirga kasyanovii]MTI26310.1 tetratricopeptide repeat protein [Fulvivirga kasyanovii]
MKYLISLALSLCFISTKGSDIDSLLNKLKTTPDGEEKIELLYKLSKGIYNSDLERAYEYAIQQKELSVKLDKQLWLAKAHGLLGFLAKQGKSPGDAIPHYVKAIEIFKNLNEYLYLADNYYNLANIFLLAEDYTNAQKYYEKAYELFSKEGDESYFAWINLNLGKCYAAKGMHELAIGKYDTALLQTKDAYTINLLYNRIGISYFDQKKYEQARNSYLQSISVEGLSDKKRKEVIAFNNIGETYLQEGDYDKAEDYFRNSLSLINYVSDADNKLTCLTLLNFGQLFLATEQLDSAEMYLKTMANKADESTINRDLLKALHLLNRVHNINAEKLIFPDGKEMLLFENLYNAQLTLLDDLNKKLIVLNNQYMLQVNYEVPLLKEQVDQLVTSLEANKIYLGITILLALAIIIPFSVVRWRYYRIKKVLS